MPRSSASVPPHPPEDPPHGLGWNAYAVLTPPPDPAVARRRRRGLVLRVSTVLAGVLQLALAGFLITLPGGSTTLDPLPGSEHDRRPEAVRVPMAAATPRPTVSGVRPSAPTPRPTTSSYGVTSRPTPAGSPKTAPTTTADPDATVSPDGPAATNAPGASAPPATRRPGPARKRGYVPPAPALSPAPRIVSTLAPLVRQPRPRATRTPSPGSVPGSASDRTWY
ncbi:hypothetical protein B0I32_114277 [Nonomuraea fuscirosea]|uniref:Uncharacterized protein n=1 Tax=Nonomuraea fuscirosea TaxID=1291556 RepID=A0A2T0MTI8_9ACTN|nr:hypothetical protein B0I32_114277 [Nonomuraea fuscirosea]